jgi:hypothetical protein
VRFNRHRRDANQKEIVETLRTLGCSVRDLSQVGDGGPDLEIGIYGHDFAVEVKEFGKVLSEDQVEWAQTWRGSRVVVLYTADQAIAWVQQLGRGLLRPCE